MGNLPRMTPQQFSMVRKLIRSKCANYDQGNCLALDDGEKCSCPQYWAYSLLCRYFRNAVLPNDPKLEEEIIGRTASPKCAICGKCLFSNGKRIKYCPECAANQRRKLDRERKRRIRRGVRF